jgi:hypothetical protein
LLIPPGFPELISFLFQSEAICFRAPSSPGTLSPSLLALVINFHSYRKLDVSPTTSHSQGRMLRHELNGMIHVPRLTHAKAAEL